MLNKILVALLLSMLLAGCGKKGPLIPPGGLVPAPVDDLRVSQKGEQFQVSWTRPARDERGGTLRQLAGFRVLRREVLPAGEDCEQCPDAYRLIRDVDLEYLREVSRQGDFFFFSDNDIVAGKTYQYKVVSLKRDGTASHDSNKVRRKKVTPPPAPLLHGRSTPSAVHLSWDSKPLTAGALLIGYNMYRSRSGSQPSLFPINDKVFPGSEYEDRRLQGGTAYVYAVRTVGRVEGEEVESAPSNEVTGKLTPPDQDRNR